MDAAKRLDDVLGAGGALAALCDTDAAPGDDDELTAGELARRVDARMTLQQWPRLLVAGGWLSLLAATIHIDLRQTGAGRRG